jgi:hypothetical protein
VAGGNFANEEVHRQIKNRLPGPPRPSTMARATRSEARARLQIHTAPEPLAVWVTSCALAAQCL